MEADDRSKPFSCDSLVHRQPIQLDVMVILNKLRFPSKCVAKHSIASGFYLVGRTNALEDGGSCLSHSSWGASSPCAQRSSLYLSLV